MLIHPSKRAEKRRGIDRFAQRKQPGSGSLFRRCSALILSVALIVLPGCGSPDEPPQPEAARELFIHCGNSMRPAAEALAVEFQQRHRIPVRLNFGGSADLLASIELGKRGDLYLPHDPYAELLEGKGLLDHYAVVGHIEPIIIVPKGNPNGIETMADLATRKLRVAVPDARYATAGRLVEDAFESMGLLEAFRANVVMEARGHNEVALALVSGHVDAAVVWSFVATSYKDRVDWIRPPDGNFPKKRVTLCLLTHARDRDAAMQFMELATSETGQRIFAELGYGLGRID